MRGGASDQTARDLLLKWFHMLEMLELRFPELRTPFPWQDAFSHKQTTQQSLAYEKACVLFNIAAALTSFAASRPRLPGNADSIRTAYTSLRQAAGMLGYIKDNFLHAPSTDMTADALKALIGLCLAQAAEVMYEKAVEDKKSPALVAKIASQVSAAYHQVADEVRQCSNKALLERLWSTLTQAKSRLFVSYTQYYRALADEAAGNHGACLVRLTIADTAAKDAVSQAANYYSMGSGWLASPTLPSDAASAFQAIVKQHAAIVAEHKATAEKDNDLIYHDVLPTENSLPSVEPVPAVTPISVPDMYSSPEMEKVVSPDLFTRLIPLQVHESASLYSEEKAKLARAETERFEIADMELMTALEYMKLPSALVPLKAAIGQATGGSELDALADPPSEVLEWATQEQQAADPEVELGQINQLRTKTGQEIHAITSLLDEESAACERGRAKWGSAKWTQDPSGALTRNMRSDLRTNREAYTAAAGSDQRISDLWNSVRQDVSLLQGGRTHLEQAYAETISASSKPSHVRKSSLLDVGEDEDRAESSSDEQLRTLVTGVDSQYTILIRLKKERQAVLSDLKDKLRDDDISQVLVLHRRSPGSTPAILAAELEKFRAYQQRLGWVNDQQSQALKRLNQAWAELNQHPKARQASMRHVHATASRDRLTARLRQAHQDADEVRTAVRRGVHFYQELESILRQIRVGAEQFVSQRRSQRDQLTSQLEWDSKALSPTPDPAPAPAPRTLSTGPDLSAGLGSLSLSSRQPTSTSGSERGNAGPPHPPAPVYRADSWSGMGSAPPPAPSKPTASPYDNMFSQGPFASYGNAASLGTGAGASGPSPAPIQPPMAGLPPPPARFQPQFQVSSAAGSASSPADQSSTALAYTQPQGHAAPPLPPAPGYPPPPRLQQSYRYPPPAPVPQPSSGLSFPPGATPPPPPPPQPAPQWQQRPTY